MKLPYFRPEPYTEREAFLWSLEQAAYLDHPQWFNGSSYSVARGEFVTSIPRMASAWSWGEKRVRNFLHRMVRVGLWSTRRAHSGAKAPTAITICNYDELQSQRSIRGQSGETLSGKERAKKRQSPGEEHKEWAKEGKNHGNTALRNKHQEGESEEERQAVKAWNDAAQSVGWSQVRTPIAPERRSRLQDLIDREGLDTWYQAISRAQSSGWLGDEEPPSWFTFDFLLRGDKFQAILEGSYDRPFDDKQW